MWGQRSPCSRAVSVVACSCRSTCVKCGCHHVTLGSLWTSVITDVESWKGHFHFLLSLQQKDKKLWSLPACTSSPSNTPFNVHIVIMMHYLSPPVGTLVKCVMIRRVLMQQQASRKKLLSHSVCWWRKFVSECNLLNHSWSESWSEITPTKSWVSGITRPCWFTFTSYEFNQMSYLILVICCWNTMRRLTWFHRFCCDIKAALIPLVSEKMQLESYPENVSGLSFFSVWLYKCENTFLALE